MTYSLNEVEALTKRAARGAGYTWGLAEEAGKAVRWLSSYGLDGAGALVALHARKNGSQEVDHGPDQLAGVWTSQSGVLCPITTGATLCDSALRIAEEGVQTAQIAYPMLIVPFAASAATRLGERVSLRWASVRIDVERDGLWIDDPKGEIGVPMVDTLQCGLSRGATGAPQPRQSRGEIDADVFAALNQFAHRTYAPSTEESRMRGAGAGVSDND